MLYALVFNLFIITTFLYVSTSNLLVFFLLYECLIIPPFLFAYFIAPGRQSIRALPYFIIQAQAGSLLVLCAVVYIVAVSGCLNFFSLQGFGFTDTETFCLYLALFLGFGLKVPVWPFHYWWIRTYVGAPGVLSMYLSGFLSKSALYGFYKISSIFLPSASTALFIVIASVGVANTLLWMRRYIDLKELATYGTVQEANLVYLVLCWGDASSAILGIIFSATHALLSVLIFFITDCVHMGYKIRSIGEAHNMAPLAVSLSLPIIPIVMFFIGLPIDIKFVGEFYLFSALIENSPVICVITILMTISFRIIKVINR